MLVAGDAGSCNPPARARERHAPALGAQPFECANAQARRRNKHRRRALRSARRCRAAATILATRSCSKRRSPRPRCSRRRSCNAARPAHEPPPEIIRRGLVFATNSATTCVGPLANSLWALQDLNLGPTDYESAALTT